MVLEIIFDLVIDKIGLARGITKIVKVSTNRKKHIIIVDESSD